MSIFQKYSPLHDGAVVIRGGRVSEVACYLPLSPDEGLPKQWGTRHRAALGLSERCDALVVVVSEERGEVSLASSGEIFPVENEEKFSEVLLRALAAVGPLKKTWWDRARSLLTHRWRIKATTVALVALVWLVLAGQQHFEVTISVPIKTENLPAQLEVLEPLDPKVKITVRGLRKDASTLSADNVHAEIDLSLARPGKGVFPVTRDHIILPNDRVQVVRIEPSRIEFRFKKKS